MQLGQTQQVPVNVVGSSTFGRYPKISLEKTYNMFISDDWMVNYPGFQNVAEILPQGEGRALYHSVRGQFLIAVVSSTVYKLAANLSPQFVGTLNTSSGEVFIDENLSSQICLVDGQDAYIYNYSNNTLTEQTLTFWVIPSFQVMFVITIHFSLLDLRQSAIIHKIGMRLNLIRQRPSN